MRSDLVCGLDRIPAKDIDSIDGEVGNGVRHSNSDGLTTPSHAHSCYNPLHTNLKTHQCLTHT